MPKSFVFGHQNPDTDSICSAIVYANLLAKLGHDVEAVRLGEINEETQYALATFQVATPRYVQTAKPEVDTVILVDHNERQQSIADLDQVRILQVIDHHRIANFQTDTPLYYRAEPVGCTATILYKLYKEHHVPIEPQMAGLMYSAIVSDTLLFESPTCTEEDRLAAHALAETAEVDIHQYGFEMLRAGANVSNKTVEQLLYGDCKSFSIGHLRVEIAQVNVIDPQEVLHRKAEIQRAIEQRISAESLHLFLFLVTDLLHNDSTALAYGEGVPIVETAFSVTLVDHEAILSGVVSRKSQVVPPLTKAAETKFPVPTTLNKDTV